MPELPEVEVLVRHLAPQLVGNTIKSVRVFDSRSIRRTSPRAFRHKLHASRFSSVRRRGKYICFRLRRAGQDFPMIGHLGMTGRLFLQPSGTKGTRPKHATVAINLGKSDLVFVDPRRFGGFSLDCSAIDRLGPEPLDRKFTVRRFAERIRKSRQPIKTRLLDQSVLAGLGNIYACEALYFAGIHPATRCCDLTGEQHQKLHFAIRQVLRKSIRFGSSLNLEFRSTESGDGLFYFGDLSAAPPSRQEQLQVYDREGEPCTRCEQLITRIMQASRSTYLCPHCQPK